MSKRVAAPTRDVDTQVAVRRLVIGNRSTHWSPGIPAGRRVVTPRTRQVEPVGGSTRVSNGRVIVTLADIPLLPDVEWRQDIAGRRHCWRYADSDKSRRHQTQNNENGTKTLTRRSPGQLVHFQRTHPFKGAKQVPGRSG